MMSDSLALYLSYELVSQDFAKRDVVVVWWFDLRNLAGKVPQTLRGR